MLDALNDDDYTLLASLQHTRLRSHFPAELQDAVLMTRSDATLVVACDWECIALLNDDWDCFARVAYVFTGCDTITFYVDGAPVLTQTRAVSLAKPLSGEQTMVKTLARTTGKQAKAVEKFEAAAAAVMTATPTRGIGEIVRELADAIAAQAIARVEASAVIVNSKFASGEFGNGTSTPEQAPVIEASAAPAKLPTVRLKGIYSPTSSNFVQSAKRYLKAVDLKDGAAALKAIIEGTPTGFAHIERAVKAYPVDMQEKARKRLTDAFKKIHADRAS